MCIRDRDYIALMPLNPDGSDPDEGTVYLYRYAEDEDGIPQIDSCLLYTSRCV